MPTDFDSPWKEALDLYLEPFLALLFPDIHREIEWSRPWVSKDPELLQVAPEGALGPWTVDKLVQVWTQKGDECWVLIHIEVQTTPERDFPTRMYVYNYRIFDRFHRSVASIAVLADDNPSWRPNEFRSSLFGCETGFRFPTVKLLDVARDEAALEASDNPFAKIVLAHRKAQDTRKNPEARYDWKIRLIRALYERGMTETEQRKIFRLIDWLMKLPPELKESFQQAVAAIEKEKQMPFVSTLESVAQCHGMHRGIETTLKARFGEAGEQLMPQVRKIFAEERLDEIFTALAASESLDEVRRICEKPPPEWIDE